MLTTVLIVLHVLVALAIIGLVLLQHGKGADMGSGFGGGASGSLFGATGSANFLSRTTAVLAALFFILSLALAYTATRKPAEEGGGVIDVIRQQQQVPAPSQKPAADVPKPEPQPQGAAPAQPPSDKQVPQ
ncbi:MAG: preprotein translocase subunit SecG [Betaproteobacteria bacterium]|nr:MAG: preprotein translocase subunit SecG [Betaproteobacteria bacterium]